MTSINDVTNELLLKYDEKFNKSYDKRLFINSTIMNKEELINKENEEIVNKDVTIAILQYTALFLLILGALFIAYGLRKLYLKKFLGITFVLFIIYLLIINFRVYYIVTPDNVKKNLSKLTVQMASYIDESISKNNPYKCPVNCSTNSSNNGNSNPTILGYSQPTLNVDSQLDVWQYGDITTDLYTTSKLTGSKFYSNYKLPNFNATIEEETANMPKPFFDSTFPSSTFYKCQWLGGDNTQAMPTNETNTYSSIPCNYRQNYSEVGKYICNRNPNGLNSTDFNNACDDVTQKN